MPSLRREEVSLVAVPGDYRDSARPRTGFHTGELATDEPVRSQRVVFRPLRNNLPEVPYAWRQRAYPWAQRALAAAEAVHGKPGDRPVLTPAQLMERRARQAQKQAEWRRKRRRAL